ncbi:MAG TPA: class I SAM-dependent methyltransferase [Gemmataceae bacterium]|jgi:ubiquinone/menaquinone biosynthesis C-methylase UbiE|nr:class I SAM-dependent methyltransferase [Gemmataceae bacterium]
MSYRTSDAREQFDSWSARYDRDLLQALIFKPSHEMMLDWLGPGVARVLDIGCGTGLFAARLRERFAHSRVYGLDLSRPMLRQGLARCQAAGGRVWQVQADSQRLPFADNAFDAVTCSHSFHHYPRQDRVMAEMHRVLRPRGRLLIIDGDRDRPWGRLLFDVIVVFLEGRVRHLTSRAFRELYRRSGFDNISQRRRRGLAPFLLTVGEAVKESAAVAPRSVA